MIKLPDDLFKFAFWWLGGAPKKIFIIFKRILIFVNNEFAFSLNLKLLLTPIYGDYSIVGRLVGFVFRVIWIAVGLVFMLIAFSAWMLAPIAWWFLPVAITIFYNILIVPFAIIGFILWKIYSKNKPDKKVYQAKAGEELKAFSLKALDHIDLIEKGLGSALEEITSLPEIEMLMKKSELLCTDCRAKLQSTDTPQKEKIIKHAFEYAVTQKTRYVEIEHVFLAILKNIPKIDLILSARGSSLSLLEGSTQWILDKKEELAKVYFWQDDFEMPKMGGTGRAMTGRVTPSLDAVSEDFTYRAKFTTNPRHVAHRKEMEEVAQILGGSRVNVLLIGDPGSGKTTMIRNMAYEIVRGTGFEALKFKRIVSLQPGALIAGAKNSGDLAQKLRKVMDDVEKSGDIILFIDEIHNLVAGVSSDSSEVSSVYGILQPYLSGGHIQFIGATNMENYRKFVEPNGAFARIFNIVKIPPSPKEETLEVIKKIAYEMEYQYSIFITFPALKKIIDLSDRLIHERVFPDKAVDVLVRTSNAISRSTKILTGEEVAKEISNMTQIPVDTLTKDESEKLLKIEEEMKKKVIGQDDAVKQIGSALKRARVGIRNEGKPIASFLFVGTTGIGKTQTAKALAATYFGDAKRMIRLDMSEYQQLDSIDRLLGSPDAKSKGILSEAVRANPFSLILLDELEKAHPQILLTFLQVLDDGRLTDTSGKVIDFTNSIIIATSNTGTRSIQQIFEAGGEFAQMQEAAMKEVRDKFAPEFLNRFNGIIVFRPLGMENVKKIADIMLNDVRKSADAKGIKVSFKPELYDELIKRGYNPQWGARPLARVIEDSVETYIATKMLSKELQMGDEVELGKEVFDL